MPRYYCDYCDTYLTHDSPSVRKQHNSGYKHKANIREYYQQFEAQQNQILIDQRIKEHLGQAAAFQQVGAPYNPMMRPRLPILPTPSMPLPGNPQLPVNSSLVPGAPVLPRPHPGFAPAPGAPPGSAPLPGLPNGLPAPLPPPPAMGGLAGMTSTPAMYQTTSSAPPSGGGVGSFPMSNAQPSEANDR